MVDGLQTICEAGSRVLRELNTGEAIVRRRSSHQCRVNTRVTLSASHFYQVVSCDFR